MNLSMHGVLHEIEQAHEDAGQFTDMLMRTPTRDSKAGGEPRERTSDPSQRDDPPARLISQYHALWLYEAQRRVEEKHAKRGWRAWAIALSAALVLVAWVGMGGLQ